MGRDRKTNTAKKAMHYYLSAKKLSHNKKKSIEEAAVNPSYFTFFLES
jgi:hypothetical protein